MTVAMKPLLANPSYRYDGWCVSKNMAVGISRSRESGNPENAAFVNSVPLQTNQRWISAFAGMTRGDIKE